MSQDTGDKRRHAPATEQNPSLPRQLRKTKQEERLDRAISETFPGERSGRGRSPDRRRGAGRRAYGPRGAAHRQEPRRGARQGCQAGRPGSAQALEACLEGIGAIVLLPSAVRKLPGAGRAPFRSCRRSLSLEKDRLRFAPEGHNRLLPRAASGDKQGITIRRPLTSLRWMRWMRS